jgi:hypothetical protein
VTVSSGNAVATEGVSSTSDMASSKNAFFTADSFQRTPRQHCRSKLALILNRSGY